MLINCLKLVVICVGRFLLHEFFRLKKSNKMQQYTDIYLRLNYSTCFGCPSRTSSEYIKL